MKTSELGKVIKNVFGKLCTSDRIHIFRPIIHLSNVFVYWLFYLWFWGYVLVGLVLLMVVYWLFNDIRDIKICITSTDRMNG